MSFKSFITDFKKHFTQAFATLAAGIIIGWVFGGAKVIKKQREQSGAIDTLTATVQYLVTQKSDFEVLNTKVDTILNQNKVIKEELVVQKAIDSEKIDKMAKDIEIIRKNTEENNRRIFDFFNK